MSITEQRVEELRRIANAHGGFVDPRTVIEHARDENSVLHDCFEWDDSKAAQEHRLNQARLLIRVSVQYLEETGQEPIPVFVSLTTDRKQGAGYRPIITVLNDRELRQQLLIDALNELSTFQRKYQRLNELDGVFSEIVKIQAKAKPTITLPSE